MNCEHKNFDAHVKVNRFEDTGGFLAEITITCADCKRPFRFMGLPTGINTQGAAVSADGAEGRFAIGPPEAVPNIIDKAAIKGFVVRLNPEQRN